MGLVTPPFWEKRLMRHGSATTTGSLLGCLNQFLTSDVWRQGQAVPGAPRRKARWNLHRLTFVLLALTWCTGDSVPECRNSTRLVCRLLSVAQTSGSHLLRVPQCAGGSSHAGVA